MEPEQITIEAAVKAMDWPVEKWEGNCFAVATQLVKSGLVKGEAVYGAWYGEINPLGYWGGRAGGMFVRHGWVLLPDGRILDPTRWSFEGVEPYIWIGSGDAKEYDHGNNRLQEMVINRTPWPHFDDGTGEYLFELLPEIVDDLENGGAVLRDPFDPEQMERDPLDFSHYRLTLTREQVFWIANFPLTRFSTKQHAREVYIQIGEHKLDAYIPIDNRRAVLGK